MRIKVVSDLHLEFSDINIKNDNNYDVLILSGDICIAEDLHSHPDVVDYHSTTFPPLGRKQLSALRYRDFFSRVSFQFPEVIYVAGNHEFYNGKWHASLDHLREHCSKYKNITFMENDNKRIGDFIFLGGSLWTDCNNNDPITMNVIKDSMNDFRIIHNDKNNYSKLRPWETVVRHKETLEYIKLITSLGEPGQKYVVVTHHTPSFQSCAEQYKGDKFINGAYHSELSEFILDNQQIVLWTHGHTHHPFDYMIGNTRVVCNPRGYEDNKGYAENTGWNPDILIEI
jgi:hypothetical protein